MPDADLIAVWQQVRKATAALDSRLTAAAGTVDTHEPLLHELLAVLAAAPDRRLAMGKLADRLALSTAGATKLVDRAAMAGWAERRYSTTDRRIVYAVLTARGAAREPASTADYADRLRTELAALGTTRLGQLQQASEILAAPTAAPTAAPDTAHPGSSTRPAQRRIGDTTASRSTRPPHRSISHLNGDPR